MKTPFKNKPQNFTEKGFSYICYFFLSMFACSLAFLFVMSFSSVALSEENKTPSQEKELSFKKIIQKTIDELKFILADIFNYGKKEESSNISNTKNLKPSEETSDQVVPKAPEKFEGEMEDVVQPEGFDSSLPQGGDIGQPSDPSLPQGGDIGQPSDPSLPQGGDVGQPSDPSLPQGGDIGQPSDPSLPQGGDVGQPSDPSLPQGGDVGQPSDPSLPQGGDVGQPSGLSSPNTNNLDPSVSLEEDVNQGFSSEIKLQVEEYMKVFEYESSNRKDPFDDPTLDLIPEEDTEVVTVPQTPPEEYNLNKINLKGIIWDTGTPKALFELPDNQGFYTLIKGDRIGKNGVIFEIRENEVIVVETNFTGSGKNRKPERSIKIKKMNRLSNM